MKDFFKTSPKMARFYGTLDKRRKEHVFKLFRSQVQSWHELAVSGTLTRFS